MRCSHFLQPSTTCCGSPPGRRLSTAGRGRASPAGCSPPCRRGWGGRSRRMGDEQRVSWQELLARARVFGEQIPRRHESVVAGVCLCRWYGARSFQTETTKTMQKTQRNPWCRKGGLHLAIRPLKKRLV